MTVVLLSLGAISALVLLARLGLDRAAHRFHWRIGRLSAYLPGWRQIGCGRCGTSWRYVKAHATTGSTARGTFTMAPLCDQCWHELGSPSARVSYYEAEFVLRRSHGEPVTTSHLVAIRAAVAAGL